MSGYGLGFGPCANEASQGCGVNSKPNMAIFTQEQRMQYNAMRQVQKQDMKQRAMIQSMKKQAPQKRVDGAGIGVL